MKKALTLDPVAQKFLNSLATLGGPPLYQLGPQDAREILLSLQKGELQGPLVDYEDLDLPCGPSGQVKVRIVRPQGGSLQKNNKALPIVLYFHGGGWVLGDQTTHDRIIREISVGAEAAVVFVNYTRSPEAQYPIPIEEAYAATQYIADHAESLNLDPSRLTVMGDSVGGNMATVVCFLAQERNGPLIQSQTLFYPVTNANFDTSSYQRFSEGYYLDREGMRWFWDNYLPDHNTRMSHHASPLQATLEQLKHLPPAMIFTGECDVLRDEGEAYAHKLIEAGVPVKSIRCLGIIHDYVMLNDLRESAAARISIPLAIENLKESFQSSVQKLAA
jgi:acetyl esterase